MIEPKKRGRKTKIETYPAIKTRLLNALNGGSTVKDACAYAGISQETYYQYVQHIPEFAESVKKAQASARVQSIGRIRLAGKNGNWQADAWFLERSDPANWGRKDMIISLGLDPSLLRTLKQQADKAGVDLAEVFEAMVNEFGTVYSPADSEEQLTGGGVSQSRTDTDD